MADSKWHLYALVTSLALLFVFLVSLLFHRMGADWPSAILGAAILGDGPVSAAFYQPS